MKALVSTVYHLFEICGSPGSYEIQIKKANYLKWRADKRLSAPQSDRSISIQLVVDAVTQINILYERAFYEKERNALLIINNIVTLPSPLIAMRAGINVSYYLIVAIYLPG